MVKSMALVFSTLVFALSLGFAGTARAQDALELFQLGQQAAAEDEWEEALGHYEEARDLAYRASIVFNVAYSLKNLDRHLEAYHALEEFESAPDADMRPELAEQAVRLRADLLRQLAQLQVAVSPSDATLTFDGETLNASQTEVFAPGRYQLVLRARGYETRELDIELSAGQFLSQVVELRPSVADEVLPVEEASLEDTTEPATERRGWWRSPVLWTVVGIVVVGGAVGLGVGLRTRCVADDCNPDWM